MPFGIAQYHKTASRISKRERSEKKFSLNFQREIYSRTLIGWIFCLRNLSCIQFSMCIFLITINCFRCKEREAVTHAHLICLEHTDGSFAVRSFTHYISSDALPSGKISPDVMRNFCLGFAIVLCSWNGPEAFEDLKIASRFELKKWFFSCEILKIKFWGKFVKFLV